MHVISESTHVRCAASSTQDIRAASSCQHRPHLLIWFRAAHVISAASRRLLLLLLNLLGVTFESTRFISESTHVTARSRENETRNARRNANRNPQWWGHCSQPVKSRICTTLKCPHHWGFRFAFQRAFRVSSSRERAVFPILLMSLLNLLMLFLNLHMFYVQPRLLKIFVLPHLANTGKSPGIMALQ